VIPDPQDVDPLRSAVTAAAGAAGCAALVLALAAEPWRGRAHATRAWGAPVALGAAAAAGFWLARPRTSSVVDGALALHVALAGGVLGALGPSQRLRLVRAFVAVLLPVLVLQFQRALHWGRVEGILWTGGLAALLYVAWNLLAAQEEREGSGAATTLGLAFAAALAAASYGLGGGAVFAQHAGALALGTGLCALLGLWRRAPGLGAGGVAPFMLLHYGHLWIARWLNDLSTPASCSSR
jgi:hypothetical protein